MKPFGHSEKQITLGSKHKPIVNSNPAPGQYETSTAATLTKPKSRAAKISKNISYKTPKAPEPDPGQYDTHLKPFGYTEKRMTLGGKYKPVKNSTPGPGTYDSHNKLATQASRTAIIRKSTNFKLK
jgi:hypothetical protein